MVYKRIEFGGAYKRITTVDDNGDYKQYIQWADGTTTAHRTDNVIAMGWKSVKEFLRERKGFLPVENRTK
jgi:hypothetical protein